MNKIADNAQFQSELSQYINIYEPNHWPVWLTLAGLMLVGMLGVLGIHFLLRCKFSKKAATDHEEKLYLYSKAVRLWHWSNATLFILLLFSGMVNHFALASASATASLVGLHKICGFLLIACWAFFLLVNLFGGNGHHYIIQPKGWLSRAFKQTRFYLVDIIGGADHPFPATEKSKFNPLQQAAYIGVVFGLIPLLFITGLLALNPEWIAGWKPWILTAHFMLAVVSLFFIVGHIYLCTTGRTTLQTFKSMIDGYHRH